MFREMRRNRQALSDVENEEILRRGSYGVLAVSGDNQYPYAVPLNYVYTDGKLFFHCAKSGHKLDAIARNSRVSFCVVDRDEVVPAKFTTYFRSVIVFGRARVLEDAQEKRQAIEQLAEKYVPGDEAGRLREIDRAFSRLCMVEIVVDHMTGKQAVELVPPNSASDGRA